jgi:hypothetical protein
VEAPAKTFTGYVTRTKRTGFDGVVELSVSCVSFGFVGANARPGLCVGREGGAG